MTVWIRACSQSGNCLEARTNRLGRIACDGPLTDRPITLVFVGIDPGTRAEGKTYCVGSAVAVHADCAGLTPTRNPRQPHDQSRRKDPLGTPLLMLGLSGENITRLIAGEPIKIPAAHLAELGLPQVEIAITYGRTEQAILAELKAHNVQIRQVEPT